jgi:hypothetical protein
LLATLRRIAIADICHLLTNGRRRCLTTQQIAFILQT